MTNILRANLKRIFREKLFWIIALALLVASGYFTYTGAVNMLNRADVLDGSLESVCFNMGMIMPIAVSVFTPLFLGTEYSEGTVRNKLIIGCRRGEIYLANLIACSAATTVFWAAWHIGSISGIPILGIWKIGIGTWLLMAVKSWLFSVAMTALFVLIEHIWTNKAASAAFSIILALALLLSASYLYNGLLEPEKSQSASIILNTDGNLEMLSSEPTDNPDYIAEPLRSVYKYALNALPTGQAILLANIDSKAREGLTLDGFGFAASCAEFALITSLGLAVFRRKDIK